MKIIKNEKEHIISKSIDFIYKVHTLYNLFFGCLWFPQLLESLNLMTLQTNFVSFQPLFHQIFFLPHIFSPLLGL